MIILLELDPSWTRPFAHMFLVVIKMVMSLIDLTPKVFEEFEAVKQVSPSYRQQRRVLVFWRCRRFWIKGIWHRCESNCCVRRYSSYVCWGTGWKHEEMCGVPASRLKVKGFFQDWEGLKRLFQQVDLAVMPSRTEGFGLTGFEEMSADLPVLVSRNSDFGEPLCSVPLVQHLWLSQRTPQP